MSLSCLVKVDRKGSVIKFNNVKSKRALSLANIVTDGDDFDFIVLEGLTDEDMSSAQFGAVMNKYKSKLYLFNCSKQFEDLENYKSVNDLQRDISFRYLINVRTYMTGIEKEIEEYKQSHEFTEHKEFTVDDLEETTESEQNKLDEAFESFKNNERIHEVGQFNSNKEIGKIITIKKELTLVEKEKEQAESSISSEEIIELRNEIESKEKKIEALEDKVSNLHDVRESIEGQLKFYKTLIESIEEKPEVIELQTSDNQETLKKLEEAESNIKQIKIENEYLTTNIESLQKELEEANTKDTKILELQERIKELSNDSNNNIADYKLVMESLQEALSLAVKGSINRDTDLENLSTAYNSLQDTNRQFIEANDKLQSRIKELQESTEIKINASIEKDSQLRWKIDELTRKLAEAESNNNKYINFKTQTSAHEEMLNSELERIKVELKTYREQERKYKEDSIKAKESLNKANLEISSLKKNLDSRRNIVSSGNDLNISVDYKGKARIIQFYGIGSYGITTAAISLAKKLSNKILIVDFDIINPSIGSWLRINPMLGTQSGLDIQTSFTSSFGILIKAGAEYFIEHEQDLDRLVYRGRTNNSEVRYFSGLYSEVLNSELNEVDFTSLFNAIGNVYDYIIVDGGKLGSNEKQTALQKMVDDISDKAFIVSINKIDAIRNTYLKCKSIGLNLNGSRWILNMNRDQKIEPIAQKIISKYKYETFLFDESSYMQNKIFDDMGTINRARLQNIVDMVEKNGK